MTQGLFDFDPTRDASAIAARMALPAVAGHRDELRDAAGALRPLWREFFSHLGAGGFADLPRRRETIERQVRDDGISYNVYSDEGRGERPWPLDLMPFFLNRILGHRAAPQFEAHLGRDGGQLGHRACGDELAAIEDGSVVTDLFQRQHATRQTPSPEQTATLDRATHLNGRNCRRAPAETAPRPLGRPVSWRAGGFRAHTPSRGARAPETQAKL